LEIGTGSLPQYLQDMSAVAHELHRVLDNRGVLWLVLGDTASGSGGAGGDYNPGGSKEGMPKWRQGETGVPPLSWCLVPQKVAVILQRQGWLIRSWITWNKGKFRPENPAHVRRPLLQSEVVIMAVKDRSYRYFPERVPERGDVWTFAPSGARRRHLAPFPEELPRRCILLSTEPGDVVFDPFSGSGTTVKVAEMLGREGVGLDLYDFQQKSPDIA
jgi:DNA modification methylase